LFNRAGGIEYLLKLAHKFISGKRSAELGIAAIVSITDIAVANNTVAILINGEVAKSLCHSFKGRPTKKCSLIKHRYQSIFQDLFL